MRNCAFLFLIAFVLVMPTWAQEDDWETATAALASSSVSQPKDTTVSVEKKDSVATVGREVPVRYWVMGDSVEMEAIFVKIENDTIFLKKPNAEEQKTLEKIEEEKSIALQESNGQVVDEDEENETQDSVATLVVETNQDSLNQVNAEQEVQPAVEEDTGADDDLETALEKEDNRIKMEEIAKVEEEIRQREIQDSIAKEKANPFIKIYRLNLRRLYNMADDEMIDLGLSNYVVPEYEDDEEEMELYPAGSANLLVTSTPAACSLFVNGIPIKQLAPDTIKKIKPGKYTISVMQNLKGVEWWGSAIVRINSDSLNKVAIAVERPSTKLTLNTDPEAVEVYINEEPSLNKMPKYMTDLVLNNIRPQAKASLYFRKVGYRDTTIVTEIKSYMPNIINVEMEPVLDDLNFIEEQNAFDKERSMRRVGRGLLWSSIVPFIAGGVMWYLAEKDWSDAADKKKAYGMSAFESPDTKKMVKDNHDLNNSGDIKAGVAAGLGFVGLGLLTAGFILAF